MTVEECCRQEYKTIKIGTIVLIFLEAICIVATYLLISFDTDKTNVEILQKFIQNEYEFCYPEHGELVDIMSYNSVYRILDAYSLLRFDMEINQEDKNIDSTDDANAMIELLIPENITEADGYIKPWIYSYAIHDVRNMIADDTEDYYEIQYKCLLMLRLHEVFLVNSIRGFVYRHAFIFVYALIVIQVALFGNGIYFIGLHIIRYRQIVRGYKNGEIE